MEKNEVTHHATERSDLSEPPNATPRRGTGAKAKRHFKRFWWLHLIIFVVVVLVITLPLVLVGFPHIAQSSMNDSTLEIQSMIITDPKPDSFHLQQHSVIRSSSSYHPLLNAFNATLSVMDNKAGRTPFASVELPAVHATADTPVDIDQTVQITDLDQYGDFAKVVLTSEEYTLAVDGKTDLHQSGLPATTVAYNKVARLKGLNGLKGFNVTMFHILLTAASDGANMVGKVYIPNPSIMTMEMGNVTMNLFVEGALIGSSVINNLTLKPGNNTVDMRSATNQSLVLQKLANYSDGILPVDVVGNSSVYHGQHLVYYEQALASNKLRVNLNVGSALSAIGLGAFTDGAGNNTV